MKKLYLRQKIFKITDHYPILNSDEQVEYYVDQDFKFVGLTVHVSDPNRHHLFTVNRKIISLLPKHWVDFADGSSLWLHSRFKLFGTKIDIEPYDLGFTVEGDFFSLNYEVKRFGETVATINRPFFSWSDRYELTILDESLQDLIVAIVITVDAIKDASENNH